jgi:hypothetical protein
MFVVLRTGDGNTTASHTHPRYLFIYLLLLKVYFLKVRVLKVRVSVEYVSEHLKKEVVWIGNLFHQSSGWILSLGQHQNGNETPFLSNIGTDFFSLDIWLP